MASALSAPHCLARSAMLITLPLIALFVVEFASPDALNAIGDRV
jgi:hypothetical protein